jgi:precorrin-6A/cobalt-precorrin-6A reductase
VSTYLNFRQNYDLMPERIWLIGGTQDSAVIATQLAAAQIPCIVSVTTSTAQALYPASPYLRTQIGHLSAEQLPTFFQDENVKGILDVSHPYATIISQLAIAAATHHKMPYLRYERPMLQRSDPRIERFDDLAHLLTSDRLCNERVLLTIGFKSLPLFKSWQTQATLFARILPSIPALEAALNAGFTRDRLIAIYPPVPLDLERALWQHWQISAIVTKASGVIGGEDVKHSLAVELEIPLLIINRPTINYPQITSDFEDVISFCKQCLM